MNESHGGTHTPFSDSSKKGIDDKDLEERTGEISSVVGSTKEARRLWPCSELKLMRIMSRRIVVGLTVSHSIRQKLRWG